MKRTTRYALVAGFTLIELMITVAVIAILGGIAYPSYQAYIRRAARAEARAVILDIAQKQERYFSSNNGYLAIAAPTTAAPTGWQNFTGGTSMAARKYNISVAVVGGTSYTITAAPANGFTESDCGTYTMTSTNVRANSGNSRPSAECWSK
ncbi:MAG TPA: type IV pilin protein [Burkholderiales bacterium]|nr:type IV pilin protein [Burkholderiales bacterium]